MAKSKAVQTLLATAIALAGTIENEDLNKAIGKLEALEDATHSNTEYKNLKDLVDELENDAGGDNPKGEESTQTDETPKDNKEKKTQVDDAGGNEPKEKPKRLNYAGIRMIGNKWYSIKDKYKKSFATADECAKHFNS
jgi:hypothetical protein